jgi:RNA polymerase sigma-70 factor (ECF subfamily)
VSDDELVGLALDGDRAAFGELVERHQGAVFRTALGALRSRDDAEDVTQDTFVAAFKELRRYRGESSVKTWLLAIAWNRVRDRRRSVRQWLRVFVGGAHDEWPHAPADGAKSAEGSLIDAEASREVRAVIGALPAKYRDPLLLSVFGEQTFDEIGCVLGIPTGTAKWRAMEARRLLRLKLVNRGYGGRRREGEPRR